MPTIKLTEKAIARLPAPTPTGRQTLYWDDALRGFGVLASGTTNAKTFIVQRQLAGKTRRVSIGPCNVLAVADARRQAVAVLADLVAGRDPKAASRSQVTLQQALDQYLATRKTLAENSRRFYNRAITRVLAAWLDTPLRNITGDMVAAKHDAIAKEVAATSRGRKSGHAMANVTMVALRTIYKHAAELSPDLPPNPCARLSRGWFPVPRRTCMVKEDQLPAFYRAVIDLPNPIHRDLILLLLFTGLRRTEAAGLQWSEIDFTAPGTIRIPASRMKAKREHLLPMTDVTRNLLIARRAAGVDRLVFPSNGRAADPAKSFKRIAEVTGIVVSPHDLRRGFATVAESCDISPMALKRLLAHSTSDVTTGYVQMAPERLRRAAQGGGRSDAGIVRHHRRRRRQRGAVAAEMMDNVRWIL